MGNGESGFGIRKSGQVGTGSESPRAKENLSPSPSGRGVGVRVRRKTANANELSRGLNLQSASPADPAMHPARIAICNDAPPSPNGEGTEVCSLPDTKQAPLPSGEGLG